MMPDNKILISFERLKSQLNSILIEYGFTRQKADLLSGIFAGSSLDGVYSHGVNRFARFIQTVKMGIVQIDEEPELLNSSGSVEQWNGNGGPGILNALRMMERAVEIAGESGIGCVGLNNTNHWMRGGTYGWLAAEKGKIGICFTNTKPNMVPWGGAEKRIGNNPLVIAIPREKGHIVLDMAMSQYSFGKIQEYAMRHQELPFPGGFDDLGNLTHDPEIILKNEKTIPIGFWKGSALSFVLDILATLVSGGDSASRIEGREEEYGLSQVFIAIQPGFLPENEKDRLIGEIISFTKNVPGFREGDKIYYPGEKTLFIRELNRKEGIPVSEKVWTEILNL
ncbi:MAG: 3-dehydro-L-gulonate 2-dehydrogenase [Cyclobacteriaceae bacterium]|nr:3-dehydro-L-gulonate 2-dehydrogenase [Cyclobacteriaceae bacterium]